jgi:DNA polymerase-1
LVRRRLRSRLLLQIHDELVLEVPDGERKEVTPLLQQQMEEAMALTVPLVVHVSYGQSLEKEE